MMTTLTRCVSAVAFLRVPLYPYPRTHTHVTAEILPVVLPVVLAEGPVHDGEVHHGIMVWHHGRVHGNGQVDVGHDSRLTSLVGNVVFRNARLFTSENILSL